LKTLKACFALFKIRVAEQVQYRIAAIANSSIGIFWGVLQIVMMTVFYTYGNPDSAAITLRQAISYVWLVQILHGLMAVYGIDSEIRGQITGGNVAVELCRPLGLYAHWFAKTAANKFGGSVWRMGFILAAALVAPAAYGLNPPDSAAGFVMFVLSVSSSFVMSISFMMVLTAIRMGLTWGEGPINALALTASVLSGSYLPLQLWPDFMQKLLLFQPFAGIFDIPFRLYIGSMPPSDSVWAIGLQLFWICVFMTVGRVLMNRKIKELIVQGG
jgi:ABC-2 type transport system permease protein